MRLSPTETPENAPEAPKVISVQARPAVALSQYPSGSQ
jgi:hypothetical protein